VKIIIVLVVAGIIFTGCKGKVRPPKGVLSKEKMSSVLWDMFQAQGWAQQASLKDSSLNLPAETKILSDKVLQIHNLSPQDFSKSYNWYLKHPDIFDELLDTLYMRKSRISGPTLKREPHEPARLEKPKINPLEKRNLTGHQAPSIK